MHLDQDLDLAVEDLDALLAVQYPMSGCAPWWTIARARLGTRPTAPLAPLNVGAGALNEMFRDGVAQVLGAQDLRRLDEAVKRVLEARGR